MDSGRKRYGNHGGPDCEIVTLCYTHDLTDLQAALGIVQLGRLEEFVAARTRVAGWYAARLRDLPTVRCSAPCPPPRVTRATCSSSGSGSTRFASAVDRQP
jgi:dTDP-4-amino-4,6-dideoxygalactose transaminase